MSSLTREDNARLFAELHALPEADRKASPIRARLIEGNLDLAMIAVNRFILAGGRAASPCLRDEYRSEGRLALIVAVDNFDPTRGFGFSGYLVVSVRLTLSTMHMMGNHPVHVPRRTMEAIAEAGRCPHASQCSGDPSGRLVADGLRVIRAATLGSDYAIDMIPAGRHDDEKQDRQAEAERVVEIALATLAKPSANLIRRAYGLKPGGYAAPADRARAARLIASATFRDACRTASA